MKPLGLEDVLDIAAYERVRDRQLAEVIALKKKRRVFVGPLVSLLFENRRTVLSQVHEMMRAERIVREEAIGEELSVYNELVPGDGELSATLFIEIEDQTRIREILDRFIGLDEPGRLFLRFEGVASVPAIFEAGHSREDRISAVHFVRFGLGDAERGALTAGAGRIDLVLRHPNYDAETAIDGEVRRSLAEDLA